jgi:hypothetical protein
MPRTFLAIALFWSATLPLSAATIVNPADSLQSDHRAGSDIGPGVTPAPANATHETYVSNLPLEDALLPPSLRAQPQSGSSGTDHSIESAVPASAVPDTVLPQATIWGMLLMVLGILCAIVWRRRVPTASEFSRSGDRSRTRPGRPRR